MSENKWELKLCSNGLYYIWKNNDLYIKKNGGYIFFDKYNKEDANDLCDLLNRQEETINELKKVSQDYEDIVANFFWENWLKFDEKLQEEIILLFDVDGDNDE